MVMNDTSDSPIRRHLFHVVSELRRTGNHGSRGQLLTALEAYARAGVFPEWSAPIEGRTRPRKPRRFFAEGRRAPRFRDPEGRWCAVGYLMSLTDPDLADAIAERFEDRFLAEMDDPRIERWAERHGFLVDELEWIQPGYCYQPPMCDQVELVETVTVEDGHSCDGPDARPKALYAGPHYCQDGCDGPFQVRVEVENRGTEDATDVTVELWTGESDIRVIASEVVDVPSASGLVVALQTDSFLDVAPNAGIAVVDPESCSSPRHSQHAWDTGTYMMPAVCGGSCDSGDTGTPDPDPDPEPVPEEPESGICGCASGPALHGWLSLFGALALSRRRR